jgi:hypothetical protein
MHFGATSRSTCSYSVSAADFISPRLTLVENYKFSGCILPMQELSQTIVIHR